MKTEELKDTIGWARANGNCTAGEFAIVLELAEIGRLAVELRAIRNRKPHYDRPLAERVKHDGEDLRAYHECSDAANAFLAQHTASAKGKA